MSNISTSQTNFRFLSNPLVLFRAVFCKMSSSFANKTILCLLKKQTDRSGQVKQSCGRKSKCNEVYIRTTLCKNTTPIQIQQLDRHAHDFIRSIQFIKKIRPTFFKGPLVYFQEKWKFGKFSFKYFKQFLLSMKTYLVSQMWSNSIC